MDLRVFGFVSLIVLTLVIMYAGKVVYDRHHEIYISGLGEYFWAPSSGVDLKSMDPNIVRRLLGYIEAYNSVGPIQISKEDSSLYSWAESMYREYGHSSIYLNGSDKYTLIYQYTSIVLRDKWDYAGSLPLIPAGFSTFVLWVVFFYYIAKGEY